MLDEMSSLYNSWDLLQQPAHPGQGINPAFRALLSAIDQGWQVESIKHSAAPLRLDTGYYLFVLRRRDAGLTRQLMLPAVPEIDLYIQNNGYPVR